jgi:peroxiredoxin
MFRYSILLISILVIFSCKQKTEKNSRIHLHFPALEGEMISLNKITDKGFVAFDSIVLREGDANEFQLWVEKADFFVLIHGKEHIFLIVKANQDIDVSSGVSDFSDSYKVSGSEESGVLQQFINYVKFEDRKRDSLIRVREAHLGKQDYLIAKGKIDSTLEVMFEKRKQYVIGQIENNPGSLANLIIVNKPFGMKRVLDERDDFDYYHLMDTSLFAHYPENHWVGDFHEKVRNLRLSQFDEYNEDRRLKPGKGAPNIVLWDTSGERHSVKHYAYEKQRVLIYFWASWNEKSLHFNEKLKTEYESLFKKNNIEIMAVSLDQSEKVWKLMLRKQQLPWLNVSDLKGMKSEVIEAYNLSRKRIPMFYFINERRRIVFREQNIDSTLLKIRKWIDNEKTGL